MMVSNWRSAPPFERADQRPVRSDQLGRIADPSRSQVPVHGLTDDAIERVQHLEHRQAGAIAAVEHEIFVGPLDQPLKRCDMGGGKVADVDVIAHAGAVGGWILVPKIRHDCASPPPLHRDLINGEPLPICRRARPGPPPRH